MSEFPDYPKMLYRFVGLPEEEWVIVPTEAAEARKRRVGFHHFAEPNPPVKGKKAKETDEDEAAESAPGNGGEEAGYPVNEGPVSEAPEDGPSPDAPGRSEAASEDPE